MQKVLSAVKKLRETAERIHTAFEAKSRNPYSSDQAEADKKLLSDQYVELSSAIEKFNEIFTDKDARELYKHEPCLDRNRHESYYIIGRNLLDRPLSLSISTWRNEFKMHLSIFPNTTGSILKGLLGDKALALATAIDNNGNTGTFERVINVAGSTRRELGLS